MKKPISMLLCILIFPILLLSVRAEAPSTNAYAEKMLQYYRHYQTEALPEIALYLDIMAQENPAEAEKWSGVMSRWRWADSQMPVLRDRLPEGLPEDDSLCIVVLGYDLKDNGTIRKELIARLEVALAAAKQYPEAYLLVTGGETSDVKGISEASAMRDWLRSRGISAKRIVVEPNAMSTTQNASRSCRILTRDYPQVTTIALVTSDYHCRWGSSLMAVAAWLAAGDALQVEVAAYNETDRADFDSYATQAQGIAMLTGVSWKEEEKPELFADRSPQIPETTPEPTVEEPEPIAAQELIPAETRPRKYWPIAVQLLLLGIWIGYRRKKKQLK